jgi:hypothetical protein
MDVTDAPAGDQPPAQYYTVFLATDRASGPRVPIAAERIVVVLGTDERTGLPLELSVSLRRPEGGGVHIYAIREPLAMEALWPDLIVEEVPAVNVRVVRVRYNP